MFVAYILAAFAMFVFGMFIGFYFGIHVDDEDKRRMENDKDYIDDSMILSMTAAIIERLKKEENDGNSGHTNAN